ncbi:acetate/propionate family kinase [Miniphocaeibacter massiliensis]|uniref:acetate/propionate family kinase n=1 Tax=Miniphocaeibacter massiliensis TaxID=2041841 RepID=UPI000C0724B9|nr:acetate kinase [Miniphocaeibacter massiliensis]
MKILVINCGSSSLKYQLFDMKDETVLGQGIVERIGIEGSKITQKVNGEKTVKEMELPDHSAAIKLVFDFLTDKEYGVIESTNDIGAIGHRVLHGGDKLTDSTLINKEVKETIKEFIKFGPLHNPANLMGIEACEEILPGKPNVAVFDTAFHQTMPAYNYMYGIPYEYYDKYQLRKYGFHGTSHKYLTHRMAELLSKPLDETNIITLHLGNGSSLAAVKNGKCLNTTMGLSPLEGLIMGTRSGDLDPTIVSFLQNEENLTADEVNSVLNKKSGVLGISGISSDFRDLEDAAVEGNERAKLALDMFHNRVRKFLGAYLLELGDVDAICFAGGVGENGVGTREIIVENLENFGLTLDKEANNTRGKEAIISTPESKIKIYVVPTNEELMIARDTLELTK